MEDYQTAFLRCVIDVDVLDSTGRRIAAMYFGGVAIECLLKYMIFSTLPADAKKEWKTETNDPGHNYNAALGCLNPTGCATRCPSHPIWLLTILCCPRTGRFLVI
jgi:hypothetical protein